MYQRLWLLRLLLLSGATVCCLMMAVPGVTIAAEDSTLSESGISESGLPLPRFVSLNFSEVNIRTGPGERYPIRWTYKRKHLPVEIIEEFEQWRKIRDADGEEGWTHKTQLTGTRTVLFKQGSLLRYAPENSAQPLVRAKASVQGDVLECAAEWCRIQVDSYKGWVQKPYLFGIYPAEIIKD